jgi:D-alanyl-D-alanine carboxypeptidase/D-alanyl-D-alanine-endopeptidase (penicillin-binding protein 4)
VTIGGTQTANAFTLEGHVPAGATEKYWLPVTGVPKYVGAVLARMLADRDVQVDGGATIAPAPLDTVVLWQHRSAPLRAIETHMLYHSDNHYAEQLLRTVGGEQFGKADDAHGIAAERRFLSARGIPIEGLQLNDASGLAVGNLVSAMTLARLLSDAELRGGDASLYMMLPQGGRQGTLKHYDFTTALGRVRAKSGHVSGVSALAGYANTYKHGRVTFAFLIDGSAGDPDAAIVRAVNRLATF